MALSSRGSAPVQLGDLAADDSDLGRLRQPSVPQPVPALSQRSEDGGVHKAFRDPASQDVSVRAVSVVAVGADLDLFTAEVIARVDHEGTCARSDVDHHALLEALLVGMLCHLRRSLSNARD